MKAIQWWYHLLRNRMIRIIVYRLQNTSIIFLFVQFIEKKFLEMFKISSTLFCRRDVNGTKHSLHRSLDSTISEPSFEYECLRRNEWNIRSSAFWRRFSSDFILWIVWSMHCDRFNVVYWYNLIVDWFIFHINRVEITQRILSSRSELDKKIDYPCSRSVSKESLFVSRELYSHFAMISIVP